MKFLTPRHKTVYTKQTPVRCKLTYAFEPLAYILKRSRDLLLNDSSRETQEHRGMYQRTIVAELHL